MTHRFLAKTFLVAFFLAFLSRAATAQAGVFWENPRILQPQGVRFSQTGMGGGLMAVSWQDFVDRGNGQYDIAISLMVSKDGENWPTRHDHLYGPIRYSSPDPTLSPPPIFSMAVDARGKIILAVSAGGLSIVIISSDDGGSTFQETARIQTLLPAVTPNLFLSARGGFILFVTESGGGTQSVEQYVSLFSSVSTDGKNWSSFAPFLTQEELKYNLIPEHASFHGKDFVVFQSRSQANTFQLYLKSSSDGGATWNSARELTDTAVFREAVQGKTHEPADFTNQRPFIAPVGGNLGLVWERNLPGAGAQIYYCELNEGGDVVTAVEKVVTAPGSIFGQIVSYKDSVFVLYTDSALASSRIALTRRGRIWGDPEILSRSLSGISSYSSAIVYGSQLLVFWETRGPAGTSLVELRPVTSVPAPELIAADFPAGKKANRSAVTIKWNDPPDPAGIKSYHSVWSVDGTKKAEEVLTKSNPTLALTADSDGTWELAVTAEDFAGNISAPGRIGFIRVTRPPNPVVVQLPPTDDEGFLASNTFSLSWSPQPMDDIARYQYGLQYLGANPPPEQPGKAAAPAVARTVVTALSKVSFYDIDDGAWAFSLSAIDTVGNVGLPATIVMKLNKFVPYTAVYRVEQNADSFGDVKLSIVGRGFTTGGKIEKLSLSLSGKPPYDYEFLGSRGDFTVVNDRLITGPKLTSDVKSGSYVLSLFHPTRLTLTWGGGVISFEAPGTIKIGDFRFRYLPGWVAERIPMYSIPTGQILVVVTVVFIGVLIVLAGRKMVGLAREGAILREEVFALIEGRPSAGWEERNRKMRELRRKGAGLRLKYTLLMIVLVFLIVLIVSIPLSIQMIGQQRTTLANGLRQRSEILVGSLATSAENLFRQSFTGNASPLYADMALVPNNKSAMTDALWATITGPGETDRAFKDYVWATNDPEWAKTHSAYSPATEKAADGVAERMSSIIDTIEADARKNIEPLVRKNDANLTLYTQLSVKLDAKSQEEAAAALNAYSKGNRDLDVGVKALSSAASIGCIPEFNPAILQDSYTFYKPVVFINREKDAKGNFLRDTEGNYLLSYYQGMVRLAVSTEQITREIISARNTLFQITGIIALVAIALGVLGAILLASITVIPIKKLAAGVAIIRDTADKEELKSHTIDVRTHDEIGMLADTVNDMTKGLVKAAIASKELMVGKDVQKMFLPLEKDSENRKGTTGGEETPRVEIYGFYEGAKGVSGDYFDFKKLDETHYAIIKCDVAGKGVPAALIMVEVATLFISYFRDWVKKKEELARVKDPGERQRRRKELERVDTLVYTINDMIEERGFKGRFAALTICLLNAESGVVTVCNAGDRIMHLYEAEQHRMVEKELPSAPAAGVFPSLLVDMKSGFKQITHKLDPGDVLFLFTDGLEESKRQFRDAALNVIGCDEPGLKEGEIHMGTHGKGTTSEEFGTPRIDGVIDAVFNRRQYRLVRSHNPIADEVLEFDFSTCDGSVKEAVLALVAVEKVYRLYRDPMADGNNRIVVDSKVDEFLQRHFLQSPIYFNHRLDGQGDGTSVTYTHLHEDDQYDDLTMLVLRKK